ncbi:ADP-ribosylglycohydrolase [Candidatus Izimaplasma bacterium HR1]|jgi:hypothetical protein|uniref:ADP-ribosylglycohydrolase family protein n=1 Tax=Candidatus Izimoplasma sp. HR1 TaxID=1541959 RepID=UPI0004F8B0C8|nr:ADP-ribosylglycohydrolase [Candidatus Izimaplasma bacterium HR1]
MRNTKMLEAALLGSASALGLNWIYDREILKKESKKGSMIFRTIDHDLYSKSEKSFDVYPNHQLGQLDFMGEVLYLYHMFYEYEKADTIERWQEYLYEYFRKENEYDGYLESYGKDFLYRFKEAIENKEKQLEETTYIDKQLGGLVFLLELYENDHSIDKIGEAVKYSKTLTAYTNISSLTVMLNELIKKLDYGIKKDDALEDVIELAPEVYKNSLNAAVTIENTDVFVDNYAGVACEIGLSLPLIFHIIKKSSSWKEAMEMNATLGGASCARGIYISAILSRIYEIPEKYKILLFYKI